MTTAATGKAQRKTVWITGASGGIGRALALRMAREGYRVVASARRREQLDALRAEAPGEVFVWPLDITDHAATRRCVDAIANEVGPIDIAVLNAGTHKPTSAAEFRAGELARIIDLNLIGTANCLEAVMPAMMDRGAGQIVAVASPAGYRGLPTGAYYGASKAALINMVEALKFDLDKAGVTIQLANPGFVKTPLTDKNTFEMPFLMSVEDAAGHLFKGIRRRTFDINFPKRLTWTLKLARLLPYRLYFPIVGAGTRA